MIPTDQAEAAALLPEVLATIEEYDTDYTERYSLVIAAIYIAHEAGYPAGFGIDHESGPDMDGYRVVAYVELPTGQVSWHMPEHPTAWDGHTTEQKYERIRSFAATRREA